MAERVSSPPDATSSIDGGSVIRRGAHGARGGFELSSSDSKAIYLPFLYTLHSYVLTCFPIRLLGTRRGEASNSKDPLLSISWREERTLLQLALSRGNFCRTCVTATTKEARS